MDMAKTVLLLWGKGRPAGHGEEGASNTRRRVSWAGNPASADAEARRFRARQTSTHVIHRRGPGTLDARAAMVWAVFQSSGPGPPCT